VIWASYLSTTWSANNNPASGKLLHSSWYYGIRKSLVSHHIWRYEEFNGYCIRAISRDPEVYPDPDAFKPGRWINNEGRLRDGPQLFIYGFGRRWALLLILSWFCNFITFSVCPGQHIANRSKWFHADDLEAHSDCYRSVFITSLLILWAFQLSLDPTARLDDMGFMKGIHQPCTIDFKTRVPETELMHMMLSWSRVEGITNSFTWGLQHLICNAALRSPCSDLALSLNDAPGWCSANAGSPVHLALEFS